MKLKWLEGGQWMLRKAVKTLAIILGFLLLVLAILDDSVNPFATLLIVGAFALGRVLGGKSSETQTEEERRRELDLKLMKGVAYKPAKSMLVNNPDKNVLHRQRRRRELYQQK